MAAPKKGGLGRGLDALFADVPVKAAQMKQRLSRTGKTVTKRIRSDT